MSTRSSFVLALLLAGCGAGGGAPGGGSADPAPLAFALGVHHSHFPLEPGTVWVYEGEDDGVPRHEVVRAGTAARDVLGIACTELVQEVSLAGVLTEVTTEWYAEDREGNVWKFGEQTLERDGDRWDLMPESWIAGEDGARPWRAFPGEPRAGDEFVGHRRGGADLFRVVSVAETASVPAGTFAPCLRIDENPEDPADADIVLYAPGIGRVSETTSTGWVALHAVEAR